MALISWAKMHRFTKIEMCCLDRVREHLIFFAPTKMFNKSVENTQNAHLLWKDFGDFAINSETKENRLSRNSTCRIGEAGHGVVCAGGKASDNQSVVQVPLVCTHT